MMTTLTRLMVVGLATLAIVGCGGGSNKGNGGGGGTAVTIPDTHSFKFCYAPSAP